MSDSPRKLQQFYVQPPRWQMSYWLSEIYIKATGAPVEPAGVNSGAERNLQKATRGKKRV